MTRSRATVQHATLATTQHVIWKCPEHAAARFEALADIPVAEQPNTFEDWVIPQDKPPPTVRLLWDQLCSFFYADGGPGGLLRRRPSVTANSLQLSHRTVALWSVWRRFAAPHSETAVGRSRARLCECYYYFFFFFAAADALKQEQRLSGIK
ncbi:hypothetical protein ISCGN_012237 [Ixodes scapularis]